MINNIKFSLNIPLDENGYLELECDYCKTRFMLTGEDYEGRDMLHVFCPVCGLPNGLFTFHCPETIEKAQAIATNWAMAEIQRVLSPSVKRMNRNSFLKMELKVPKSEPEREIYKPIDDYCQTYFPCCSISAKIRELDEQIGAYCPICGGTGI